MLSQIDDMYHIEVKKALTWLAFESRPLTLAELAEACSIDPDDEIFVDICNRGPLRGTLELLAGLISVEVINVVSSGSWISPDHDETLSDVATAGAILSDTVRPNARVRLAHISVKEYLMSDRIFQRPVAKFALNREVSQERLAQSCVAYVLH